MWPTPPLAKLLRGGRASELQAEATWPLLPHLYHVIAPGLVAVFAFPKLSRVEFSEFEYGGGACATEDGAFCCRYENRAALAWAC